MARLNYLRATTAALLLVVGLTLPARGQEEPALGQYHITAELGAMVMQHVTFESDDAGLQVGLAAYRHLRNDWYLGAELKAGGNVAVLGGDSEITMVEINAKRVFPLTGWLCVDAGAGLSYNSVSYDHFSFFGSEDDQTIEEWVFGGQVLAGIHLKLGPILGGVNAGYMLTEDVPGVAELRGLDEGWDYSHLSLGIHAGFLLP